MSTPRDRRHKRIVTPEGVALELTVPLLSVRLVAFVFDLLMLGLATVGLWIAQSVCARIAPSLDKYLAALTTVAIFLVWSAYPIWFESRPSGATPGKRRCGLRVVDRTGGSLRVDQVIVRSLIRWIELPIPAIFLFGYLNESLPDHLGSASFALAVLAISALVPMIHHDGARIGDLVAGTLVISTPETKLLTDLARNTEAPAESHYSFSREQLSIYGVYELQVLEEILRDSARLSNDKALAIARTIEKKLGLEYVVSDPIPFLREFYAAQRAFLERQLALGRRKESKSLASDSSSSPSRMK